MDLGLSRNVPARIGVGIYLGAGVRGGTAQSNETTMKKHRASVSITGKVQGVWFRAHTQEKARELDITGFVRNMPDGSVYCEAEGSEERLQELIDWCRQGSPAASVDKVAVIRMEPAGDKDFVISG